MRRFMIAILVVSAMILSTGSTFAAGKKAARVGICHYDGGGVVHAITINGNAWKAHQLHGDYLQDANGSCVI